MKEKKYCNCGKCIIVSHKSKKTYRTDGLRFFHPEDNDGSCLFRCCKCKEAIYYDNLKTRKD